MSDAHAAAYREEACELLAELESSLLALEEAPDDADLVGRVFRAMHTIKGSGAMFGFDEIAAFTHDVESVFDKVRKGQLAVTPDLVAAALAARDRIRVMLDDDTARASDPAAREIIVALRALGSAAAPAAPAPGTGGAAPRPPDAAAARSAARGGPQTWRILFRPSADILRRGTDPRALIEELAALGPCRAFLRHDAIPVLEDLDPESCYCGWDICLTTDRGRDAIRDVFIFVEEDGELSIDLIDDGEADDPAYRRIGEILVDRGVVSAEAVQDALRAVENRPRMTDVLVEQGLLAPATVESALLEQEHVREQRAKRQAAEAASSIRVPADRLDVLVNLVGELVTVQARFSAISSRRNDAELLAISEEVERLTWELRDSAMNIRMLPIGSTFSKFKRLVHDLARELSKSIELTVEGGETELDKTVIEKLGDPLVHLIRNAVDHGIELPEARAAAGKPEAGRVHLSAEHSGAHVLLRIRDDGAGLDPEAIRAKAVERGLLAAGADLPEKDLYSLILLPGFSTARALSNVSGRGVGMDVVKQAVDNLHGTIEIASVRGRGTTFTIKIPLTLAIIDGLLVTLGAASFVIPLAVVEECVELTAADTARANGRNLAIVRGQLVPYVRLREEFLVRGDRPPIEHVVITEVDGRRVGFVVDHIVGQHQTVIKSLGRMYRGIEGLSGSTILGDGTVALILDMPKLVRLAETREAALVG